MADVLSLPVFAATNRRRRTLTTETVQKLLIAMAFAGFMGASFGAAFGLALTRTVDAAEAKNEAVCNE